MDCPSFSRWLDAGRPAGDRGLAMAHTATCTACAELEASDRALTAALSQRFTSAPAGFQDRVLAALPARAAPTAVPIHEPVDPLPWFVRVLLQPSTALALALGGIVATHMDRLTDTAFGVGAATTAWWSDLLPSVPSAWASGLGGALMIGLLGLSTWGLARLAEALIAHDAIEPSKPR